MKSGQKLLALLYFALLGLYFINPENRSWVHVIAITISFAVTVLLPYLFGYLDGKGDS